MIQFGNWVFTLAWKIRKGEVPLNIRREDIGTFLSCIYWTEGRLMPSQLIHENIGSGVCLGQ